MKRAARLSTPLLAVMLMTTLTGCHLILPFESTVIPASSTFLCSAEIYRDVAGSSVQVTEEWQAYVWPGTVDPAVARSRCTQKIGQYISTAMAPGFSWNYRNLTALAVTKPVAADCSVPSGPDTFGAPLGAELRWNAPPASQASAYISLVDKNGVTRTASPTIGNAYADFAERDGMRDWANAGGAYVVGKHHVRFSDLYLELNTPFALGPDMTIDQFRIQSIGTIIAEQDGAGTTYKVYTGDAEMYLYAAGRKSGENGVTSFCFANTTVIGMTLYQGPPYPFFTLALNLGPTVIGFQANVQVSLSKPQAPGSFKTHQPYVQLTNKTVSSLPATLTADLAYDADGDLATQLWFEDFEKPTEKLLGAGTIVPNLRFKAGQHSITLLAYDSKRSYNSDSMILTVPNFAPVGWKDSYWDVVQDAPYVVAAPGVLANDTDANGDALQAYLVEPAYYGTVNLGPNGGFTYTPPPGFTGSDTFTYIANDGADNSDITRVSLQVSPSQAGIRISYMGPDGDPTYRANDPAVAYNPALDEYMVVWSGDDDGDTVNNEFEIWGQRVDAATGALVGTEIRVSNMRPNPNTEYDAFDPAIAYNPTTGEYLVVWMGDDETGSLVDNEFEIWGQRLAGDGTQVGPNDFRISDMGPDGSWLYSAIGPGVAYNPAAGEYLVVWSGDDNAGGLADNEWEIYGQRLTATGTEVGANDFRISDMGPDGNASYSASAASIAYNQVRNEYMVVWNGTDNTGSLVPDEYEIYGQRLAADGSAVGVNDFRISDAGPDGDPSYDALYPSLAYNPAADQYLVTWDGDDTTGNLIQDEFEIFGQLLDGAGAEVGSNDFRISEMGFSESSAYRAVEPATVYDPIADEYLVVWQGDATFPGHVENEFEIFGERLTASGGPTGYDDVRITHMGPDGDYRYDAAMAAVAVNTTANEYLVVWSGDDYRPPLVDEEAEIFGEVVPAGPAVPPPPLPVPGHQTHDIGLVDPSTGVWSLRDLTTGQVKTFYYGNPGDLPMMGDWDCDGVETPGLYRQSDGYVYLRNSNTQGVADIRFYLGNPGDIPLAGDFDGDGCDTVGVYRPSEGRVYITNVLGANEGYFIAQFDYYFGNPGDKPFVGDFNGNGQETIGLHRESTGFVYFRQTHTQGVADAEFFYGDPGDRLIAGDWGILDGIDTVAVFRPSLAKFFFRFTNTQGVADTELTWGESDWLPVAGEC